MGRRQQHCYRTEPAPFPPDFAARLDEFRAASGLSWRELARLLRVNVRTLHRWRSGTGPDAGHLLSLLELAARQKLLHVLAPGLVAHPSEIAGSPVCPHFGLDVCDYHEHLRY